MVSEQETRAKGPNEKYCADCGKLILLRAEICPGCGCRQAPTATPSNAGTFTVRADPLLGPMLLLLFLNCLWSGLGNIAIGDKRGWAYGFFNWIVFIVSWFTAFLPSIAFFVFCSFRGYEYLRSLQLAGAPISAPTYVEPSS